MIDTLKNINDKSAKQNIEQQAQQIKEVEYHYEGSLVPYNGHNVYCINTTTFEVELAEYVKRDEIGWFEAIHSMRHGYKKEILIKPGFVYISALNSESALKRLKNGKGSAIREFGNMPLH